MLGGNRLTPERVQETLSQIIIPGPQKDVVTLGWVRDVSVDDGHVQLTLFLPPTAGELRDPLRLRIQETIRALDGVDGVNIKLTGPGAAAGAGADAGGHPSHGHGPGHDPAPAAELIPGVANTLAVTSGKGGVGKSTVAANLAVALAHSGARVGLLDADVYGPSIPTMFGVPENERPMLNEQHLIAPIERLGIKLMSIGFMVERDAAMIMRGPMLAKYVNETLERVDWGELDYLIIDLPPGTGDVQLTLMQTIPLTGAIVVTQPQQVALADVRRAVSMCQKLNTPVLGLIENMSDPILPDGQRIALFGRGGGQQAAREWGIEFLGEVPLDPAVPPTGDAGTPIVATDGDSPVKAAFHAIAAEVTERTAADPDASRQPSLRITD